MQWLAEISVKRPIFATVLILFVVVLGWAGYANLGVDRFPAVDFPSVSVVTTMPGAAPEEIETELTEKLEEAINSVSGIDELRSTSAEGISTIFIQFDLDVDLEAAAQDVRDRVSQTLLPDDADEPIVSKFDSGATPIMYLSLASDRPLRELTELADDELRGGIENVAGVGQVKLVGGRLRQVQIVLDPLRLRAHAVSAAEVQAAVARQNLSMPGGRLESGPRQVTLRVEGRVASLADIGGIIVREQAGKVLRVRDVASVEDAAEEAETLAIRDGVGTVVLSIRKQSGANTVAVVDAVRERVEELKKGLPAGTTLDVVRDNSETVRTSVHSVKEHLVVGAIFAALVVLLFLGNVRSTVIAAIAIPVSIIGTFLLMWVEGFTLDTITLLALALAVGIVIDDAIVVLENIHRHIEEHGTSPARAAVEATKEIGLAVLATTLSLIAVFVPVAFMDGIVGRFLKSFGLTMAFAIAVSMLVSFTLTPMLCARWLKAHRPHAAGGALDRTKKKSLLERIVDRFYGPVERVYMRILAWVMRRRWTVVVAAVVTLGSVVPLMAVVPKGFLPRSDEAHFEINVRVAEGTSLEATGLVAERLARQVRELPGVKSTLVLIGDNNEKTPNLLRVYVKLVEPKDREDSQDELMARVRDEILPGLPPGLQMDVSEVPAFSGGPAQATIQYLMNGPELDELTRLSAVKLAELKQVPGAVDVKSSLIDGKPEVTVTIDRDRAAALGVQVADITSTLRLLVGGQDVSTYEEDGEAYDVFVRAAPGYRMDREGLALVDVPSATRGTVPLLDVVKLEATTGPSQIEHLARRRTVQFTANVAVGASEGAVGAAFAKILNADLPDGYRVEAAGRSKEMAKTMQTFLLAFGLSLLFMYLILAAQFESWLHPVTILVSLPLTLPFALVSLLIFGQQLDIFSMLGLLVLFGVVKKNSILVIDHINHLRGQGLARAEAVLVANKDRLRPILMTTLAFVAGMIPLQLSNGIGSGYNHATAGVILGGQVLSLLLTLLATPVAYTLFDDAQVWLGKKLGRKAQAVEAEAEVAA